MNEAERIAMLARIFATGGAATPLVEFGIGDDAAVLGVNFASGQGRLVWTIDEQVEGTHFRRDLASYFDVGWRSFMAAASDVAAMGASPWCALAALVVPDHVDDDGFEEIGHGQSAAAQALGVSIVGGNLARGPALSIATTLLGVCDRAVLRGGARPGDGVWLAGRVGLAAAGFRALEAGRADHVALRLAVDSWRRPMALIASGRAMGPLASAAIDVSDGLAADVGHLADSSGVRVVLDEGALADVDLSAAAAALGADALDLALYGGEDYALVATSRGGIEGFRRIGFITDGHGVALRGARGESSLEPRGYDHFTFGRPSAASRS